MTRPIVFTSSDTSIQKAPSCPKNAPAHYKAIHAEALRVGWPEKYAGDLTTIDRLTLTGTALDHADQGKRLNHPNPIGASEPFAWVLRRDGTVLMPIVGTSRESSGSAHGCVMAFGENDCRFYAWDGVALLTFKCASDLDDWMRKQRETANTHFPGTLCGDSGKHGCTRRWMIRAKGQGWNGADRFYCEEHKPDGRACLDCETWITPGYRERYGALQTVCDACTKKRERKAAKIERKMP